MGGRGAEGSCTSSMEVPHSRHCLQKPESRREGECIVTRQLCVHQTVHCMRLTLRQPPAWWSYWLGHLRSRDQGDQLLERGVGG